MSCEFSVTVAVQDDMNVSVCSPDGQLFSLPSNLLPQGLSPGNILNVSLSISRPDERTRRNELNQVCCYFDASDSYHQIMQDVAHYVERIDDSDHC